jgi:glycosyltransferase 2 family protein
VKILTDPVDQGTASNKKILLRKTIKIVSLIVVLAAVYWVGQHLFAEAAKLKDQYLNMSTAWAILACAILYAGIQVIISWSWGVIYSGASRTRVKLLDVMMLYGQSHVAKYIPGNIAQVLQRQLLGAKMGWSQISIAVASFLEIILAVSGVLVLVLLFGLNDISRIVGLEFATGPFIFGLAGLLLAGPWIFFAIAHRLPFLPAFLNAKDLKEFAFGSAIPVGFFLLMLFFALKAVIFWFLGHSLSIEGATGNLLQVSAAFLVAWLGGYLALGAPGGIGVREALIVLLLGPVLGDLNAAFLATAFRVVNVTGDLIFFAAVMVVGFLRRRLGHQADLESTIN